MGMQNGSAAVVNNLVILQGWGNGHQCVLPVILATWEAEIMRIAV
jgi:hypothetical protein